MEGIIAQRTAFGRHVAISHTEGTGYGLKYFPLPPSPYGLRIAVTPGRRHELLLNVELVLNGKSSSYRLASNCCLLASLQRSLQ